MPADWLMPGHHWDGKHGHTIVVVPGTSSADLAQTTLDILREDGDAHVQWLDVTTAFVYAVAETAVSAVLRGRTGSIVFVPTPTTFTFQNAPQLDLWSAS